jgi:hypothetical protein
MDEIAKRALAEARCQLFGKRGQKLRTEIEHVLIGKWIEIQMANNPTARLAAVKMDAADHFGVDIRTIETAWRRSRTYLNKRADKANKAK